MKIITRSIYYCEEHDRFLFIKYCNYWNTSLTEIAKELNVSKSFLSAVLRGKKSVPQTLVKELFNIIRYADEKI